MFGGTFRMPWHGYLMLSLAVAAFAVWMHSDLVRVEQEKKAALAQPAPAPVTLAAFRKDTDIHLSGCILNYFIYTRLSVFPSSK